MGFEVDFLPVGDGEKSGDAIALRFGNLLSPNPTQSVVVIDGGYTDSGKALVRHIQQYYRTDTVDLVIATHPDADHVLGLFEVLDNLRVGTLAMHLPWNHTDDIARMFKDGRVTDTGVSEGLRRALEDAYGLEKLAKKKGIPIVEPFQGADGFSGQLVILGPSKDYYESLLPGFRCTPEPIASPTILGKAIAATKEIAARVAESWNIETLDDSGETSAENNSSVISLLQIDGKALLFTADAGMPALTQATAYLESRGVNKASINFVQVPHHGSRRNVGPTILNRLLGPIQATEARTRTAFVSVSEKAAPKHPSKRVTNAFRRRGAPVHATQGQSKRHHFNAPDRGWSASTALPLYETFDE